MIRCKGIDDISQSPEEEDPASFDDIWRNDVILREVDTDNVDLVCLDVFDTLLLRRCGSPDAVFSMVAQTARLRGQLDNSITDWAFTLLRRDAETGARRNLDQAAFRAEITLTDIYANLCLHDTDMGVIAAIERECEKRTVVANPYVADFIRHLRRRGIPVILLSDMYLSAVDIESMLASAGLHCGTTYDKLYVSCEFGTTKASGGLFFRMLADFPSLSAGRVLHIGDNSISDLAGAAAAGIRAALYAPPSRWSALNTRELRLGPTLQGAMTSARVMAARTASEIHDPFWFSFGCQVLGPVAVHYSQWVVRDAAARGIRRIAPLMREGCLLAQLMKRQAQRLSLDMDIRPLHVSRGALLLPALEAFDTNELELLGVDSVYRTVGHLAELLGLEPLPEILAGHADVPLIDIVGAQGRQGSETFTALRD